LLIEYAKKEKFHKERNSIYVQRDFLQQILHVKKKKKVHGKRHKKCKGGKCRRHLKQRCSGKFCTKCKGPGCIHKTPKCKGKKCPKRKCPKTHRFHHGKCLKSKTEEIKKKRN